MISNTNKQITFIHSTRIYALLVANKNLTSTDSYIKFNNN